MNDIRPAITTATDPTVDLHFRDYVEICQQRKWWIIVTAVSVFVAVAVAAFRLPRIYMAQTVILMNSQKVPESYVRSTETSSIADRLSTIQQQVMSETRLRKLIDSMKLYPELKARMGAQDIVTRMQKLINVEVVNQGGRQESAFRISFQDKNPATAAQVANQLASMFIDENLKVREQQSYGTADFLSSELEKTKKALDEKEQTLSDIKRRNIADLPESKQFHLQALESLRGQLQTSQDRVQRAQQDKVYLESLLTTIPTTIDLDAESASPYQAQIGRIESNLSQLRQRYGPDHPDVRKLQAELNKLNAEAAEAEKSRPGQPTTRGPARTVHNPVVESQIEKLNEVIQHENDVQSELQPQLRMHMAKLENVPIFEQKMASLMRDYDTVRTYYTGLLDKKLAAETASALESRQKGERFVILDPAVIPDKPSAPNRPLLLVIGFFAGILGGFGLAVVMETADESIRNEKDLKRLTGTPVLAVIPVIWTAKERGLIFLRRAGMMTAAVVCSVGVGWVVGLVGGGMI